MGSRPRTEAGGRADSVQRSAYRCRSLVAILLDPHTPLLPSHVPLPVLPRHREMVELQLPHLKWDDALPPIASFYSYAAVMKE